MPAQIIAWRNDGESFRREQRVPRQKKSPPTCQCPVQARTICRLAGWWQPGRKTQASRLGHWLPAAPSCAAGSNLEPARPLSRPTLQRLISSGETVRPPPAKNKRGETWKLNAFSTTVSLRLLVALRQGRGYAWLVDFLTWIYLSWQERNFVGEQPTRRRKTRLKYGMESKPDSKATSLMRICRFNKSRLAVSIFN